jgi:hypothetical protein
VISNERRSGFTARYARLRDRKNMKRLYTLMTTIGISVVTVASLSTAAMAATGAATGTSHSMSHSAAVHHASSAKPDTGAYTNCQSGLWCDYIGTNGTYECIYSAGSTNWANTLFQCRNLDESFANRTSGLVRLYYSPNEQGAWACINASKYENNLAGFTFNNESKANTPGYGKPIEDDVASSEVASGNCSNPLNWP